MKEGSDICHDQYYNLHVVYDFRYRFGFYILLTLNIVFILCFSGYATDNIIRVLQGEKIGTVFHRDAHLWKNIKEESAHEMAVAARNSSRRLQVKTVI